MPSRHPARALGAVERCVAAAVGSPWFWAAFVAAAAAWPVAWSLAHPLPAAPPVLGRIPSFRLTDGEGRPFDASQLAGKVWLAGAVDGGASQLVVKRMARVQDRTRQLAPEFHLLSLADARDAPGSLPERSRGLRVSPRLWTFASGDDGALRRALFGAGGRAVATAGALALVDRQGRVRRRYDAYEPGVVDRIVGDVALLVNVPERRAAPDALDARPVLQAGGSERADDLGR